jgi:hypothetical protein
MDIAFLLCGRFKERQAIPRGASDNSKNASPLRETERCLLEIPSAQLNRRGRITWRENMGSKRKRDGCTCELRASRQRLTMSCSCLVSYRSLWSTLKLLRRAVNTNPQRLGRLRREALGVPSGQHHHIPTFHLTVEKSLSSWMM